MMGTGTLLVNYRLSANKKIKSTLKQINLLKTFQINNQDCINKMSKALVRELDLKMQQVREYGLIAHGYHNENVQYPVHVRRSHDGEKVGRKNPNVTNSDNQHKINRFSDSTVLTSSLHENRTGKLKEKKFITRQYSSDERHIIPPNKTINDINPLLNSDRIYTHRKSSLSLTNSSPILCSVRPHSIAGISVSTTDEQQINSLSNSSQSLINQSPPIKTLTQRFFSKFFHQSSKS